MIGKILRMIQFIAHPDQPAAAIHFGSTGVYNFRLLECPVIKDVIPVFNLQTTPVKKKKTCKK
jgi:hypothetical protein